MELNHSKIVCMFGTTAIITIINYYYYKFIIIIIVVVVVVLVVVMQSDTWRWWNMKGNRERKKERSWDFYLVI